MGDQKHPIKLNFRFFKQLVVYQNAILHLKGSVNHSLFQSLPIGSLILTYLTLLRAMHLFATNSVHVVIFLFHIFQNFSLKPIRKFIDKKVDPLY